MSMLLLFDVRSKLSCSDPLCLVVYFCTYGVNGIDILYEVGILLK